MTSSSEPLTFKVVLLGEGCVGKTSIVLRYTQNKYNEKHLTTLQACFFEKRLVVDGRRVTLNIWDTAGQERFHALGPIYYRDSHAGLLVYDITDEDSFEKVQNWVKELRKVRGNEVLLYLIGNKLDLEKDRHVPLENAENFASTVGGSHTQTSAKQNHGIDELFLDLTRALLQKMDEESRMTVLHDSSRPARQNGLVIVDDNDARGGSSGNRSSCSC